MRGVIAGTIGGALLRVLVSAAGARAQTPGVPSVEMQILDSPALGAGIVVTFRLIDHATGLPVPAARIEAARLFGPSGAALVAMPLAEVAFGVYAVRVDLPAPGVWTLQTTVAAPDRAEFVVSAPLTARTPLQAATRTDPAAAVEDRASAQAPSPPLAPPAAEPPAPN